MTYRRRWSMASESLPPESPSSTRSPSLIMSKSLSAWLSGLRIFAGGLASFLDWRLDLGLASIWEATVATAVETPDSGSGSGSGASSSSTTFSSSTFSTSTFSSSTFSLSDSPTPRPTAAPPSVRGSPSVSRRSPTQRGAARFWINPPRTFSVLSVTRSGCLRLSIREDPAPAGDGCRIGPRSSMPGGRIAPATPRTSGR